jgi:hypothetical protein
MDQFLYLSSYPFGNTREAGEMPGLAYNQIPDGFTPRINLQQMFTQRLVARSQMALEMRSQNCSRTRMVRSSASVDGTVTLEKQIAAICLTLPIQRSKPGISFTRY